MDISSLESITPGYMGTERTGSLFQTDTEEGESFSSVLSAAMDLLEETNELQNDAEAAQIQFVLGEADNPHDMQIAAKKALTAIQYTTAVRDKLLEVYKEIMNMQI